MIGTRIALRALPESHGLGAGHRPRGVCVGAEYPLFMRRYTGAGERTREPEERRPGQPRSFVDQQCLLGNGALTGELDLTLKGMTVRPYRVPLVLDVCRVQHRAHRRRQRGSNRAQTNGMYAARGTP